jgi:hypothetical protein
MSKSLGITLGDFFTKASGHTVYLPPYKQKQATRPPPHPRSPFPLFQSDPNSNTAEWAGWLLKKATAADLLFHNSGFRLKCLKMSKIFLKVRHLL